MAGPQLAKTAAALADQVIAGDRRAVARAITWVENGDARSGALLEALYPKLGAGSRIGITGPPGAGKSTLTAALAGKLCARGQTIGIVCVDPTSPFTGGALLGDRIRMNAIATDPGVFIRSMASRGSLGGIAHRTGEVCDVLEASGRDPVLIETVGVGQAEVDVAGAADTTVVVLSPEAGDAIQAMKAGLMEAADVFCVNKADRDGADRMVRAVQAMLELSSAGAETWRPPVLATQARTGDGVDALIEALDAHRAHLIGASRLDHKRRARIDSDIRSLVRERLWELFEEATAGEGEAGISGRVDAVLEGSTTPQRAARDLLVTMRDSLRGDRP